MVQQKICDDYDLKMCLKTLKRFIKSSCNLAWKRVRKSLKCKRNQKLFKEQQKVLKKLSKKHERGEIKLFYYDQSGFNLTPNVPYAWQGKDCEHLLPSSSGGHHNVLAMISPDNEFKSYIVKGRVDSEVAIDVLRGFFKNKRKNQKYVIVLDNAPIHTSELFLDFIEECRNKNIEFEFLPPYSPELNKIEILWNLIKTKWLPLGYTSCSETMVSSLINVLSNIGVKYRMNFV